MVSKTRVMTPTEFVELMEENHDKTNIFDDYGPVEIRTSLFRYSATGTQTKNGSKIITLEDMEGRV